MFLGEIKNHRWDNILKIKIFKHSYEYINTFKHYKICDND